jgi:hypothetical protein
MRVSAATRMQRWQIMLLVNFVGLACMVAEIFLLASSTVVWTWALASGCTLICINGFAFEMLRKTTQVNTPSGLPSATAKKPIFAGPIFWVWFAASSYYALFRTGVSGALITSDIGIFLLCVTLVSFLKRMDERSSE